MEGTFVKNIKGIRTNYKVMGKGTDVLLLHGWGCDLKIFDSVQKHLGKSFKAYAIDLPGFGESEEPPGVWGVEEYTGFIEQFIADVQIKDPVIIGHSFGGRIAILLASRRPLEKIILVDSAGIKPGRTLSYYIKVYSYKLIKKLSEAPLVSKFVEGFFEKYKNRAGSEDYKNASTRMKHVLVKVVNEDLRDVMPGIGASTLLIWGENDTATPVRDAKIMEKLIPDAGLVILKDVGHYSFLEKLGEFLVIVDHFLKNEKS